MLRRVFIAALMPASAGATDPLEGALLAGVNAFRARSGMAPLGQDPRLSRAALAHSRDMLASNRMSHRGSDGSDVGLRLHRVGYRWLACRENIAAGLVDPRGVVAMWINSPPHRANMLAQDVTQMGAGHAEGPGSLPGNIPRMFWTLVLATPPRAGAEATPPPVSGTAPDRS